MKHQLHFIAFCLSLIVCILVIAPASALPPTAQQSDSADAAIDELLRSLELPRYNDRESATRQLVEQGASALPRLARYYFDAPPESLYRIRKVLEGISASGDEDTFLRSTSLLLALYSNGGDQMNSRIEALKYDWRRRRKAAALEALVNAGATVVPYGINGRQPQIRAMVRMGRTEATAKAADESEPPKLSKPEQKRLVEKILSNSADENREFIFDTASPSKKNSVQQRVTSSNQQRLKVTFPVQWPADERILGRLREIESTIALELRRTSLPEAAWKIIKDNTAIFSVALDEVAIPKRALDGLPVGLQSLALSNYDLQPDFCRSLEDLHSLAELRLNNCTFSDSSIDALNRLRRVSTIPVSFDNKPLDRKTLDALAGLQRFRNLSLTNVSVASDALATFEQLNQVNTVELRSMKADKALLESFGRMKRVNLIVLRGCKFDIATFSKLKAARRRIEFQPSAFLGVGPSGPSGQATCQIAFVSPNSAASDGGIQVGDTILEINGNPVTVFEDVRLQIAQLDPGDEMQVKLRRNNQVTRIKVELGTNPQFSR